MRRPPLRPALALLAAALVAGCMSQPYRNQSLYTLDGGATSAAAAQGAPHPGTLRLRAVVMAEPYAGTEFAYRYADARMRIDPYAGLIALPEVLIGEAVVDRLSRERVFQEVVGPDLATVTAYELVINVTELCPDFSQGEAPVARITGRAFLVDPTGRQPMLRLTLDVSAAAPITADTPDAVAAALNEALGQWLGDLAAQLRAAKVPPLIHPGTGKDK